MQFDELYSRTVNWLKNRFKDGQPNVTGPGLHTFMCEVTGFRSTTPGQEDQPDMRGQTGIFVSVLETLICEELLIHTGTRFGDPASRVPHFGMTFRTSPTVRNVAVDDGPDAGYIEHSSPGIELTMPFEQFKALAGLSSGTVVKPLSDQEREILKALHDRGPMKADELAGKVFRKLQRGGNVGRAIRALKIRGAIKAGKGRSSKGYEITETGRGFLPKCD